MTPFARKRVDVALAEFWAEDARKEDEPLEDETPKERAKRARKHCHDGARAAEVERRLGRLILWLEHKREALCYPFRGGAAKILVKDFPRVSRKYNVTVADIIEDVRDVGEAILLERSHGVGKTK
jgi:hypothetical protein